MIGYNDSVRLKEKFIAHGCHLLIIQGFHVRARADVDRLVLLRITNHFGIPEWFFFLEMEFGNGKGFLKRNL